MINQAEQLISHFPKALQLITGVPLREVAKGGFTNKFRWPEPKSPLQVSHFVARRRPFNDVIPDHFSNTTSFTLCSLSFVIFFLRKN